MDIIKRIVGVVLIIAAVVLAVHTVVEPLYFDSSTTSSGYNESVWALINSLSAFAVVLGVAFGYARIRKSGDPRAARRSPENSWLPIYSSSESCSWESCSSSTGSIFSVQISMRWVPTRVALVWLAIDAGLPLIWFPMGLHLLKGDS